MRRSAMVASDPWTLVITLIDDPDSLGAIAEFRALNSEGGPADSWDLYFASLEEALAALEREYGLGPEDWVDLE
ncbi:MAG TPA: hypothetical protein VK191_03860 [Symbiobacteriaceae bacterium]|nr:hypothetical protein [Symbiobacteriaceae bacterium]